jgi:uncharacterized protein
MTGVTDDAGGTPAVDVVITNNEAAHQYEAHVNGQLAGRTTYRLQGERVVFIHAEVSPTWEGRGIATTMVRYAFDDVISRGGRITPLCPFVVGFVRRNPSYLEYVDPSQSGGSEPATNE